MRGWPGIVVGVLLAHRALAAPAGGVTVFTEGWDFTLPPSVQPAPYAGLLWMGRPATRPEFRHEGHTLAWSELHPEPGRFDFSRALAILDAAKAKGRGVVFRLDTFILHEKTPWGTSPVAIPGWLIHQSGPRSADMAAGDDDTYPGCVIRIAVPWDEAVRQAHLDFIRALGTSGIPAHPALLGFYVHGVSTSLGEEFWLSRKAFLNLKAAGMTATVLEASFGERIQAWADAFDTHKGKLAWVGSGWIDAPDSEWEKYAACGETLDRLALSEGLGWRGGGIETVNQMFERQGQSLTDDGYLITDWTHPLVDEPRYFGDENEIFNPKEDSAPYRYRASVLRALALGMRFLWTGDDPVSLDPAVSRYFNLTAGRSPADSPDAWCWLREATVKRKGKAVPMKNIERGLRQRDADAALTKPAMWTTRRKEWTDGGNAGEWAGRRTDLTASGTGIGFIVDPAFSGNVDAVHDGPGITLKVTWLDDGARWRADYSAGEDIRKTHAVIGRGDGKVKTVTVRLPGFTDSRAVQSRYDLMLVPEAGNLTAQFVRLVFAE